MKRKDMCYDTSYKHKLNMLEPGTIMIKAVGALAAAGALLWAAGWYGIAGAALALAGAVFAALMVLVGIEAHQDRVLNDIAMRENSELRKEYPERRR